MSKTYICILTVSILLISGSARKCVSIDGRFEFLQKTNPRLDLFTPSFYRAVIENHKDENVFMSPFSIATVLSMVYLGSKGNTAKQFENVLNISSVKEKIHLENEENLSKLRIVSKKFILKSANRIYANKKLIIDKSYESKLSMFYKSTIERVDLINKSAQTAAAINHWIAEYTNGKIKNMVSTNTLQPDTILLLVNAIYFKGTWEEKFNKINTEKGDFFLNSNQKVKRDLMFQIATFYSQNDRYSDCQILELPYLGKRLSMFVILPNKIDGLASLEQKLNPEFLENLVHKKGFSRYTTRVYLPKFRLETRFKLGDILAQMGLTDVFDENTSNLSGIVREPMKACVSNVIHKTFVDVDERGTEAAAATVAINRMSLSYPDPREDLEFKVDHPFLFCIVDFRIQKVLFIGRVKDPP